MKKIMYTMILVIALTVFAATPVMAYTSKCIYTGCKNDAVHNYWYCRSHECATYGCHHRKSDGSSYCYDHKPSKKSSSYSSSKTSSKSTYSSNKKSNSSSNKKSSGWDSYDKGYEDVWLDDDYDWDRYQSDSDYADGVDDAMEDWDW